MDAATFLNTKYKWLFSFFDSDGNGILERNDFHERASRASNAVKEHLMQQPNGAEVLSRHFGAIQQAQSTAYNTLFDELLRSADAAGDRKISYDEWITFCYSVKQYVDQTGQLPQWFNDLLVRYFTNVLDFNGNGKLEFFELTFMGDAPPDVTWYCFDKLTNANAIPLDQNLFIQMCTNYMTSTDQGSNSRYVFGFVPGAESYLS